jgi:hypothetical protein
MSTAAAFRVPATLVAERRRACARAWLLVAPRDPRWRIGFALALLSLVNHVALGAVTLQRRRS